MTKADDPAHPTTVDHAAFGQPDGTMVPPWTEPFRGLTKREYFAAMAMQGLLAHPLKIDAVPAEPMIAAMSRLMADALIVELNKEPK